MPPLRLRLTTVISVSSLLALAACSAGHDSETDSNESASESELRALTASEIVGTLEYGQTSATVDYTSTPLYRAFRFNGSSGDQVVAWVRSTTGGDARAWLVDASFRNVVSNDNANSATLDAQLTSTLRASGVYYVVFRDKASEDASFNVTLTKTGGGAACDPEEDTGCAGSVARNAFDPASCQGPAMTQSEAVAHFSAAQTEAKIGDYQASVRTRYCNTVTGCSGWVADNAKPQIHWYKSWYNRYSGSEHSEGNIDDTTRGDVLLKTSGTSVYLSLRSTGAGGARTFDCGYVSSVAPCNASLTGTVEGGSPSIYLLGVDLGRKVNDVVLTRSCFRAALHAKTASDASGAYQEAELVYAARF